MALVLLGSIIYHRGLRAPIPRQQRRGHRDLAQADAAVVGRHPPVEQHLEARRLEAAQRRSGEQAVLEAAAGQGDPRLADPPGQLDDRPGEGVVEPGGDDARAGAAARGRRAPPRPAAASRARAGRDRPPGPSARRRRWRTGRRPRPTGRRRAPAPWRPGPRRLTLWRRPARAATPSNRRPALVVVGELKPGRQHPAEKPAVGGGEAAQRRPGRRRPAPPRRRPARAATARCAAARAPPPRRRAAGTGAAGATRRKPAASPSRNSPPQIVPSVP